MREDHRCRAVFPGGATLVALAAGLALLTLPGPARADHAGGHAGELFRKHRTNYFLFGVNGDLGNDRNVEEKFQLSFRYGLFAWSRASVNFAYTQRSFWRLLDEQSSPFRETNYLPELFVEWRRSECLDPIGAAFEVRQVEAPQKETLCSPVYGPSTLVLSYEHESNGRGANDGSRSWNRVYLQASWEIFGGFTARDRESNWLLRLTPRIWGPFAIASENSNITDYYGFGDLYVEIVAPMRRLFPWWDTHAELELYLRPAEKALATQASLKLRPWPAVLSIWLLAQWWRGPGQDLSRFDQQDNQLRLGILFRD
jgi:outer membrane phospholipase A